MATKKSTTLNLKKLHFNQIAIKNIKVNWKIITTFIGLTLLMTLAYFDLKQEVNKKSVVVNMEKLYQSFHMTKTLEKKYVQLSKERGSAIDSLNSVMQTLQVPQNNQGNAVAVNQKIQTVAYTQAALQQENETMRFELEQQIWNQLNQYLYQFGQENNYSIILGSMGHGNVIYVEQSVDITDKAIEFVNEKYQGIQ